MVVNELIIEKTGERVRLTDGEAEAFRSGRPLRRYADIKVTATYRRDEYLRPPHGIKGKR
ncbi:TPA: hypothetical protein ACJJHR_000479 [Neisseria meningitidis]